MLPKLIHAVSSKAPYNTSRNWAEEFGVAGCLQLIAIAVGIICLLLYILSQMDKRKKKFTGDEPLDRADGSTDSDGK